jgi:tetratricopeptide (TPR) repeat protein
VALFRRKKWLFVVAILSLCSIATYVTGHILVSSSAEESIRRAQRSFAVGQPAEARQQLKWLLWFAPDHAAANFLIGQCFLEQKNYDSAIRHFELIEASEPEFKTSQQMLAGCFLNVNQLENAEIVLRSILKASPESLAVRRELAVLLRGQMRSDEAIQVLLESIDQQSELPTMDRLAVLRDLLTAQFLAPLAEQCVESLENAHALHPGQKTVMAALAACLLDLGRETEAELLIDQLSITPQSATTANVLRIRCLIAKAKYAEARKLSARLDEEIASNSNTYQRRKFYILKSRLQELASDYEAAGQLLERAASIAPLDRASAIRYARLLQRAGRTDLSSELFAAVHRRAEAELALWHLSGRVRDKMPTRDECDRISRLFDTLDMATQSAEWRRMAEAIESISDNHADFGFRTSQ